MAQASLWLPNVWLPPVDMRGIMFLFWGKHVHGGKQVAHASEPASILG